jgi:hypothetical protein
MIILGKQKLFYYLSRLSLKHALFFFNGVLALIIYKFGRKNKANKVILIGSGDGNYHNNTAILHNFLMEKYRYTPKIKILWVTHDDNDKFDFPTLRRGTVRAYLNSFRATVLIFDTVNGDLCPGFMRYTSGTKMLLNHGFDFLKDIGSTYYQQIAADIITCASEQEKNVKMNSFGAKKSQLIVTGYPRFDYYKKKCPKQADGVVLVMFTWPSEAKDRRTVVETMRNVCRKMDETEPQISTRIHLHPMLKNFMESIYKEDDFQDTHNLKSSIESSAILITDYSSVCWDFFVQGKKVYFLPSKNDYANAQLKILVESGLFNYNPILPDIFSPKDLFKDDNVYPYDLETLKRFIGTTESQQANKLMSELIEKKCFS